ncbi:MAG: CopG family antitoxin [Verrucomicrobiota bacterium]|nr:CopG family antitoxin [Verrucomicrobiota bacterium]
MNQISDWEEVPQFDDEAAEAAYWANTGVVPRLMGLSLAQSGEGIESITISLRMDPRMLSKIKRLARSRYLGYQSMIKQWLSERMEQETKDQ